MNRRQMLFTSAALAVAPRLTMAQTAAAKAVPNLSPAVLDAVSTSFITLGVKAHKNALIQSDFTSTAGPMLSLLEEHFKEAGMDDFLKQTVKARRMSVPDTLDVSHSKMVADTYSALVKADPTFTRGEVESAFLHTLTPKNISASLDRLQNEGITPSIHALHAHIPRVASRFPVSYHESAKASLVRTQTGFTDGSASSPRGQPSEGEWVCFYVDFATASFGTAAFILGLGCLESGPFFEVICPATVKIGIIAGILGIIDWIACS